jgi:hypothetical protein
MEQPTQMAIPLQMESKDFVEQLVAATRRVFGSDPAGTFKGVDLESESQ